MGARPSSFKKSGGFLNNVVGTITGYRFTDEAPSKDGPVPFKPGKVKGPDGKLKDKFHTLYMELFARADGAKEDVSTYLFAGGADDFVVSEDGLTLTDPKGAACTLGEGTSVGILVASLVEAGFPEEELPEDENSVNYETIVGRRVRFEQRKDVEATTQFGKRKDKKNPGRSYDRTNLVVSEYLGVAEEAPAQARPTQSAKPVASVTKSTTSGITKANGKAAVKTAAKPASVDIPALATSTLLDILAENENTIQKVKLSTRILQRLMKDPNRDDVRTWLFNDENLSSIDGVTYDQASGVISIG